MHELKLKPTNDDFRLKTGALLFEMNLRLGLLQLYHLAHTDAIAASSFPVPSQ